MITCLTKFSMVFLILCWPLSCNSSQPGCTDPQANNYDELATDDDNSCVYDSIFISPEWSVELSEQVHETSGLIYWDEKLWTINDNTDTRLYALDPATGEISRSYSLEGVRNRDWEEISQDEEYLYVGDFGNNGGDRKDLHILRIEKQSLLSASPSIDTIWYSYSDQESFIPSGLNQTEFDCEALVVSTDSIYLFTKQWTSGFTTKYSLPKVPGNYIARKGESLDVKGMITGASFLESEGLLLLCGYTGIMQPFICLFYDYQGHEFFSGKRKRINISLPVHQVEGIAALDEKGCYISNEFSSVNQMFEISQKLHYIDLTGQTGE